jgi:hypothetical protein
MVDVEKILLNLDVSLTAQRSDEVQGYCPMHEKRTGKEDHNPSWWINTNTGAHICFSCGYKGNIYTLVADIKGIDYFDAKDYINEGAEIPLDSLMKRIKELPQYVAADEPIAADEAVLVPANEPMSPTDEPPTDSEQILLLFYDNSQMYVRTNAVMEIFPDEEGMHDTKKELLSTFTWFQSPIIFFSLTLTHNKFYSGILPPILKQ